MQEENQLDLLEENKKLKEELKAMKEKGFSFSENFNSDELLNDLEGEFSKLKDKTQEVSLELKDRIKENPLQSISIAFTLGLVLSRVFGGRR